MLRNQNSSYYSPQLLQEEVSLLQKKDQQIRRLQAELDQERRRADNAVKMLENFKSIHLKTEEGQESLRTELTRRLRAEEEAKKLQARNDYLQEGIRRFLKQNKKNEDDLEGDEVVNCQD